MLPFKLVYSEKYFLPIGEHVFRADKFRLIRERLLREGVAEESDFVTPAPATEAEVMLVHSPHYVNKLMEGGLSVREELQMEIPYSPQIVDAFMLHTGGSIQAAELALRDGVGINIGGGFHHAFPDHGEGFCMINDFAVAIRVLPETRSHPPRDDCRLRCPPGQRYCFHLRQQLGGKAQYAAFGIGLDPLKGRLRRPCDCSDERCFHHLAASGK